MTSKILFSFTIIMLLSSSFVAGSVQSNQILYIKGSSIGGGGFTTDQNDELNTTGQPIFDRVTISSYMGVGGSDQIRFTSPYVEFRDGIYINDIKGLKISPNFEHKFEALSDSISTTTLKNTYEPFGGGSYIQTISMNGFTGDMSFTDTGGTVTLDTLRTDDDNPESGEVHWSDLTDVGTHNTHGVCQYYGSDEINCNGTITTGGEGFTTDQNDELNTTGDSQFNSLKIGSTAELYDDGEDFYIQNKNVDDFTHIVTETDAGAMDFVQIGGSDISQKIRINPNQTVSLDVNGLLSFYGDYVFSQIGILMASKGTYTGNYFYLFNSQQTFNVTGAAGLFRFQPGYVTGTKQLAKIFDLNKASHIANIDSKYEIINMARNTIPIYAFSDDDSTIENNYFSVGNPYLFGVLSGTKAPNITEVDYEAIGGIDRVNFGWPSVGGKLDQTGFKCTGFGDLTNPEPQDDIYCMHSDGGIINLSGNSDLYSDDYYSGLGNQGLTTNITGLGGTNCWQDFEDGLLVAHNCSTGT